VAAMSIAGDRPTMEVPNLKIEEKLVMTIPMIFDEFRSDEGQYAVVDFFIIVLYLKVVHQSASATPSIME
jgi:hypothetical protein